MIEVTVTETGTLQKTLQVTVPRQRVDEEYGRLLDDLRKKANIPGFRPGKAPRAVIEQRFGDSLQSELVQNLLPKALQEAVAEAGVAPAGDPDVRDLDFGPGKPMSFRAILEVWPEVEVRGYDDNVEIEQEVETVAPEQVDAALDEMRSRRAEEVPVERPSIAGDLVAAELVPVDIEGKRIPGAETQKVVMEAGSEGLLPEFREASLGIGPGAERSLEVQYPEDYGQDELRGQKRRYLLRVREIREKKPPPLDDQFAQGIDPELDLAGLRGQVREKLQAELEARADREAVEKVIDRLLSANPFPVPEGVLRRGMEALGRRFGGFEGGDEERNRRLKPFVERLHRRQILLDALAEKEGLEISDEDVQAHIRKMADEGGVHPTRLRKAMEERGDLARLRDDLQEKRTLEFLMEKVTVHKFTKSDQAGEKVSKGGIILPGKA